MLTRALSQFHRWCRVFSFILVFVLIPPLLLAQRGFRHPVGPEPAIDYEPVNLISENPDKSRLDVSFRISHDYFVFTRNLNQTFPWPFIARADITLEVIDNTKTSVAREIVRKEIGSEEPPSNSMEKEFLQGVFSFELPPGDYSLFFEIIDLQSSRRFVDQDKKISLKNFKNVQLETSDLLFIEPLNLQGAKPQRFLPLSLGGDVFLGQDFDGYIEFAGTDLDQRRPTIQYHLQFYDPEERKNVSIVQDSVSRDHMLVRTTLEIVNSEAMYVYRIASSSLRQKYAAILDIDGERLQQGRYNLEIIIKSAQAEKKIQLPFRVRWIDMPLSLRDIDFAVSAMRHLIGAEVDKWRALQAEEKLKTFNRFWTAKDETPETALNEVQEEYFRRADYAFLNFSSSRRPNGILTDRGKIYMLYGPPTKTERKLVPKRAPQEFWYYEAIEKLFIFEDQSRVGDYQLIKNEPL